MYSQTWKGAGGIVWSVLKYQKYQKLYQETVSYLSEPWCLVYPRAMNEQGMEEHSVSLLHDKVNLGCLLILLKQSMEKFVGFTLKKKAELKSLG